eukprot:gene17156-20567_t
MNRSASVDLPWSMLQADCPLKNSRELYLMRRPDVIHGDQEQKCPDRSNGAFFVHKRGLNRPDATARSRPR